MGRPRLYCRSIMSFCIRYIEKLNHYLVALTRTSLHFLPVGGLELVQHTCPNDANVGIDRDHIKALLGTDASIIAVRA